MFPIDASLYNLNYYNSSQVEVHVFHCLGSQWGTYLNGLESCGRIKCNFFTSGDVGYLNELSKKVNYNSNLLTVGIYNVHSCGGHAEKCVPKVNLTLFETEESFATCQKWGGGCEDLQMSRNVYYDGAVTVHPWATIPRIYSEAYLNHSNFLPLTKYENLVPAAAWVASNCHNTNNQRYETIKLLRQLGLRIDGLGKCLHSIGIGGVGIQNNARLSPQFHAINKYMFYIAFENTYEPGYVTEKGFLPLVAGTVPIYFGDTDTYKSLLPGDNAAIFASSFGGNLEELVKYVNQLMRDKTEYEKFRSWRHSFSPNDYDARMKQNPYMAKSWRCRTCEWAIQTYYQSPRTLKRHRKHCGDP